MTADIRTAAQREAGSEYPETPFAPESEQLAKAFEEGAVWGADRVTPTREQIATTVHEAFSMWHSKRELNRKYPELHDHPGSYYEPMADAVLALIQELAEWK